MTAAALGLILLAAVLHAFWNLLAKRVGGGPAFVWLYGTTAALLLALAPRSSSWYSAHNSHSPPRHSPSPARSSTPFTSSCFNWLIGRATSRSSTRLRAGTGPVLSTIAAIAVLGERPSALALFGAVLVALSVFALARPARSHAADARKAVVFGLITGVLIAAYTICDKQVVGPDGVPPLIQQFGTSIGISVLLAPFAFLRPPRSAATSVIIAVTCWRSGSWCRRRTSSYSPP